MDCSPPGSSVRGIFQARVLGWGTRAFSDTYIYNATYNKVSFKFTFNWRLIALQR